MVDIDDIIADEEGSGEKNSEGKTGSYNSSLELDDFLGDTGAAENLNSKNDSREDKDSLIYVGKVTHYYQKANVVAIELSCEINLGDSIVIADPSGDVKMTINSMQIDRKNVDSATSGDFVGIKVDSQIAQGSKVYKNHP